MEIFLANNSILLFIIIIFWVLPWKGYAMWTAAQRGHKKWFIVFLILNTLSILEIFYVFQIAKKKPKDLLGIFKTKV
jgi:4-amino-4-deoxy-L-arabinose transferase-like glycosyltransferase